MTLAALLSIVVAKGFDLEVDAASAGEVVAKMTPMVGTHLILDEAIAKEIVVVRFHEVEPAEALKRFAQGLNASWAPEGNALRLTRTESQVLAEREATVAWTASHLLPYKREIQTALDAFPRFDPKLTLKGLAAAWNARRPNHFVEDANRESQARQMLPGYLLELELRAAFDPKALAKQPYRRRIVYSNNPNRRQRPLNLEMTKAFRTYDARRNALIEAEKSIEMVTPDQDGRQLTDFVPDLLPARGYGYRLWIRREEGGISVGSILVDSAGKFLSGGGEETIVYRPTKPDVAEPKGEPELSPEPRLKAWKISRFDGLYPEPIRTELQRPEKFEPLRDIGHYLVRCAETRGQNLVAVLADRMFAAYPRDKERPGAYLNRLYQSAHVANETDGWLFVHPADPGRARRERVDRQVWGEWIRLTGKGELTLSEQFRLSPRVPLVEDNPFPAFLVTHASGGRGDWNYPAVRVLASMPPAMRNSGVFPLNRLSGLARETALQRLEDGELPIPFESEDRNVAATEMQKSGILDATDVLVNPGPSAMTIETRETRLVQDADPGRRRLIELRLGFNGRIGIQLYFSGLDDLGNLVPVR